MAKSKTISRTSLIKLSIFLSILILPCATYAQLPPLEDDPGQVPIDGGASLLVGAAVVYGAKKLKERKKAKENEGSL